MNADDLRLIELLRREARAVVPVAPASLKASVMAALDAPRAASSPARGTIVRFSAGFAAAACLAGLATFGVSRWMERRETQREAARLSSDFAAAADYFAENVGPIAGASGPAGG